MSDHTRRGFLKVAAAGSAAAGFATVLPSSAADAAAPTALPRSPHSSIVAHIENVHSGVLTLMVEGHSVTVTDRDLVARIAQALHAATASTSV